MKSQYPEHEKQAKVIEKSQAIGEFLDTCGYTLGEYREQRGALSDPPTGAELTSWALDINSDLARSVTAQCELTVATQLLNDYMHKGYIDGQATTEFLKRQEGR